MLYTNKVPNIESDKPHKIFLFGNGGVGKTTLVQRTLNEEFQRDTPMTIGTNYYSKYFEIEGIKTLVHIWDFGGEDCFKHLLPSYAKGSDGGIFMYDITRRASLFCAGDWLSIFEHSLNNGKKNIPILLVGGKSDLCDRRSVFEEDVIDIKENYHFDSHFECSSKKCENIDIIFETLMRAILKNKQII